MRQDELTNHRAPSFSRVIVVVCLLSSAFFIAFRLLTPIAIDTAFMHDTMYLASLGWRGVNGLWPIVDYWNFYGGFTAANVTLAFTLFGVSLKSVDYAFVIVFAWATLLLAVFSWKRISLLGFCICLLVVATIILGPISIEDGYSPHVNRSFIYNHFAMAVIVGLTIFIAQPITSSPIWDAATGFVAGIALVILVLAKATFVVVAPFIFAACFFQRQYTTSLCMLAGLMVAFFLLDPGAMRFVGSLEEIWHAGQLERVGGFVGRILYIFRTVAWHAVFVLLVVFFAWRLWLAEGRPVALQMLSIFLGVLSFGAATLSMNGQPSLMMLPILIVALLLVADMLKRSEGGQATLVYLTSSAMTAVLVLPAVFYSIQVLGLVDDARSRQLITEGPASSYMVLDMGNPYRLPSAGNIEQRLETAVSEVAARIPNGGQNYNSDAYVVLADGVQLLNSIPDVSHYAIISRGSLFDFTVPLQSKPVPSFPVWPLERSTSFLRMSEVDIIMTTNVLGSDDFFTDEMQKIFEMEFKECKSSQFFVLWVRQTAADIPCVSETWN